jgi:uncharacterized phage protein (predicted DNA packaging)
MPDSPISPVSLNDAKAHLRLDSADDDALVGRLLIAAAQFFENETNLILTDGSDVPQLLQQGILLMLGHLYENREAATDRTISEVPLAIQRIVLQYINPAVAG